MHILRNNNALNERKRNCQGQPCETVSICCAYLVLVYYIVFLHIIHTYMNILCALVYHLSFVGTASYPFYGFFPLYHFVAITKKIYL